MLLGIYPDPELVDQRLELQPGDALVLFTDGLTERRDPNDDPSRRIGDLLRSGAGASADETAARLGQLALSDDGRANDDVAVVVLRRLDSRDGNGVAPARTPSRSIAVELEPGPRCPAEARDALSPLADALDTRAYMDLRLLVSELVTNCVRHARLSPGDPIRLRVERSDRMLRVEVSDPGPGFDPEAAEPVSGEAGGWGLFLTERLADRWGVDGEEGLTRVWLELDLLPAGSASQG
jgi:anti-sigma regulatory factor (Ser/Thr protein kinase)